MYPQNHVTQRATARVARVKAPDFKVQRGRTYWLPGFEGFSGGSWWDVDIVEQRDKYYLAKYLSNNAEEDETWLPLNHLRLRTRKADDWDCHILKRGIDISVSGMHSDDANLAVHPKALYDARIVQITRFAHDMKCTCLFHVNLYSVGEGQDPSPGRTSLSHSSATREVDISNVRVLQQPVNLTFEEIFRSHMFENWLPIKWGNDAFFLRETKLTLVDCQEDDAEGTLPAYDVTRWEKPGASLRPSKGAASALHDSDRNVTCKGKARAGARDSSDQQQKFDAANKVARGLKDGGHILEPVVRASEEGNRDRFEELDELEFDYYDQHGARTRDDRIKAPERAVGMDFGIGKAGQGVGGRAYDKCRRRIEDYGLNAAFARENYDERDGKVRPDCFDDYRARSRHDNLDTEGTGKLGRGDRVEPAAKASRPILNMENRAKLPQQNPAQSSPEMVRGEKKGGDKVMGTHRKKQEPSPCHTGKRFDGTRKQDDPRKRQRSRIIIDTSSEEEESEDVVDDSVCSDDSSKHSEPQWKKRTKENVRDHPRVTAKLSRDREERLKRRNRARNTSRDDSQSKSDRGNEHKGRQAPAAEKLHRSGKSQSDVKSRKSSLPKKSDKIPPRPDREEVIAAKHMGAESASRSVRKRGRPKKPATPPAATAKGKATAKGERKNSASSKDTSVKGKAFSEVKNGNDLKTKAEYSASSKDTSAKGKACSEVKNGKDLKPKAESPPKSKASVVIDLEEDDSDEIEDNAPIGKEGLGTEKMKRLRDRQPCTHSAGREAAQADVILPARLRSQNMEKKKPATAGSCLASTKDCRAEVQNAEDQKFVQRPLYLDVLQDSRNKETPVQDGAHKERKSGKTGVDLDSGLGPTMSDFSVPMSEENHAVIKLQNQNAKASECQDSDVQPMSGSASVMETGGGAGINSVLMDTAGGLVGQVISDRTSVDEHDKILQGASTESNSADKTVDSLALEKFIEAEKSKSEMNSQAQDADLATLST